MPDLYTIAAAFRAALLAQERAAARAMVRAYGLAWQMIRADLATLTTQIAAAQAAGTPVRPSWLYQEQRLARLQQQVVTALNGYAEIAAATIVQQQAAAIALAQGDSVALIAAAFEPLPVGVLPLPIAPLPNAVLVDLVGFLADGSPLRDLLDTLGPAAAQATEQALISGIVAGQNPRAIARAMRQDLGVSLTRSLRISRTEVMRSYRETSARTYQRHNELLDGWVWTCALDRRACMACVAMHGTLHPVEERLDGHPNCRCVPVPRVKSWQALGYDLADTRPAIESGPDYFAGLPPAEQQERMGPGKYAAYAEGTLALPDLVGRHTDPRWGSHRYERSLKAIREGY